MALVVGGCGGEDGESESAAETTVETTNSSVEGGTSGTESEAGSQTQSEAESGAESTTGGETTAAPESTSETGFESGDTVGAGCAEVECDPTTHYCHEHIEDAPSYYTCEPLPRACSDDPTCECVLAEACPRSPQGCEMAEDGLVLLECVEG